MWKPTWLGLCAASALVTAAVGGPSIVSAQPAISIGSERGAPGQEVRLRVSLESNGLSVVQISPLVFEFDPAVLSPRPPTESSCTALTPGKSATALSSTAGRLAINISGGTETIADGEFLECTFRIAAGAAVDTSTVSFVTAEGSDQQLNDFSVAGTHGSVAVVRTHSSTQGEGAARFGDEG